METKVDRYFDNMQKAFNAFQRIKERYINPPALAQEEDIDAYMTTMIKRFEFIYKMLWKFFKVYLIKIQGDTVMGSKDVFRKMYAYSLLTQEQTDILLAIIDDCNLAAHEYDEESAHNLSNRIINCYAGVLEHLYRSLVPSLLEEYRTTINGDRDI